MVDDLVQPHLRFLAVILSLVILSTAQILKATSTLLQVIITKFLSLLIFQYLNYRQLARFASRAGCIPKKTMC